MFTKKTLLAAAALAALTAAGIGAAEAQPAHRAIAAHPAARHDVRRPAAHRPYVAHVRVLATLRLHHFVGLGDPYFFHGRYVVRSHDRFGHVVLVQIDPYTGAYIGMTKI